MTWFNSVDSAISFDRTSSRFSLRTAASLPRLTAGGNDSTYAGKVWRPFLVKPCGTPRVQSEVSPHRVQISRRAVRIRPQYATLNTKRKAQRGTQSRPDNAVLRSVHPRATAERSATSRLPCR